MEFYVKLFLLGSEYDYDEKQAAATQRFTDSINDRDFGTRYGSGIPRQQPKSDTIFSFEETKKVKSPQKIQEYSQRSEKKERKFNAFECLQNKNSKRCYIEIEKEHCELPYITLTESDENYLMDIGVKLRYGDSKSFAEASRELESHLLKDYPLETFLQRTEILNATLDIMVSTVDTTTFNN